MRTLQNRLQYAGLLLLLNLPLLAQSGTQHFFEQGNQAYRAADYQLALEWYQKIPATGYSSSDVYYNIGNCYFKLNQIGGAILYYEKALRMAPGDSEIRFNLELANSRILDRVEQPPRFFLLQWRDAVIEAFSLGQLSWIVALCYILSIALAALWLFRRENRLLNGGLSTSLLLTLLFSTLLVAAAYRASRPAAVVLTPKVNVLSAPDEKGTDVFLLHEGVKVELAEQRGAWVKITLPDGKSGWVKSGTLGMIN